MTKDWAGCKRVLCIRPDNMGDLLMSSPAIRALKESLNCSITVLTSGMATGIAGFISEIDEVITYDLPWVKLNEIPDNSSFFRLIEDLRERKFDAAVVFNVYSQNPLPSAMIAYLSGIPKRLAYCRENPYDLLTHWIPDKEPYSFIQHQVRRDLQLVHSVGCSTNNEKLSLQTSADATTEVTKILRNSGIQLNRPWIILHPGVSERKREYPEEEWIDVAKRICTTLNYQVLLTGGRSEKSLTDSLQQKIGEGSFSLAGSFSIEHYIALLAMSPLIVSVNSGPVHIAAATGTPVIVLYALTNPQHLPWKAKGKALLYDIPTELRSKNEVIKFVHEHLIYPVEKMVTADDVFAAAEEVLSEADALEFPEMIPLMTYADNKAAVSFSTNS